MIKSMTGYGGAKGVSDKTEISIEIRSVNNRHLDVSVKLPRGFIALEEPLKAVVSSCISRGKIDVFITIDSSASDDIEINVNHALAKAYIVALKSIAEENALTNNYDSLQIGSSVDIAKFPDVLQATKREVDKDKLLSDISEILKTALTDFDDMRSREGEKLERDMSGRLTEIERLTGMVEEISPRSVAEYRKKLTSRLSEVLESSNVDEARILTEAAIFADRVSVSEETVRLRSHISMLRSLLEGTEPVGRKIDFLLQEFNRETNTIGSKGNDVELSKVIVDLKAEIEKIREQAQNIE
ncbi:MAG: YicC family protein [Oscillospiraceae bacterium]|nr:YicC family protein [Oscillospiraceae bacterium]MCL2278327.1 YicC family protein [Oscillospiraceae bacterium]